MAKKTPKAGRIDKQRGLIAGIPDMCLAVPSEPHHALYIEFKTEKGTISTEQKITALNLSLQGYLVVFIRSVDEFMQVIPDYLHRRLPSQKC